MSATHFVFDGASPVSKRGSLAEFVPDRSVGSAIAIEWTLARQNPESLDALEPPISVVPYVSLSCRISDSEPRLAFSQKVTDT
jgi:hypothetical protein